MRLCFKHLDKQSLFSCLSFCVLLSLENVVIVAEYFFSFFVSFATGVFNGLAFRGHFKSIPDLCAVVRDALKQVGINRQFAVRPLLHVFSEEKLYYPVRFLSSQAFVSLLIE